MTFDRSRRGREPALNLLTTVAYVNGSILVFVAVAMVSAAVVSAVYSEFETAAWISVSAVITEIGRAHV